MEAGYAGEKIADRYLERCQFKESAVILPDIQLKVDHLVRIQLDTLIVTPSTLIILEVKNMAGRMIYHDNPPHFECVYPNRPSLTMECPHMQVENSRQYLLRWLAAQGFEVPVQSKIVLANQKTSVHQAPSEMPLIYAKHLPLFFHSQISQKDVLSPQQMKLLVRKLMDQQSVFNPFPLSKYLDLHPGSLAKGCICEECGLPLQRLSQRRWVCPECGQPEKHAVGRALQDYFMIFDDEITNESCREFLGVNSRSARYILTGRTLRKGGNGKSVLYSADPFVSAENGKGML